MKEYISAEATILDKIKNLPIFCDPLGSQTNKDIVTKSYLTPRVFTVYYLEPSLLRNSNGEVIGQSISNCDKVPLETFKADFLSMEDRMDSLSVEQNIHRSRIGFTEHSEGE